MALSLKSLKEVVAPVGPVVLLIMDGVGLGPKTDANAVHLAKTPVIDALLNAPLYTELKAHGTAVGMPSDEDMGNSEVGHNALGAGRVFDQGASLVKNAIDAQVMYQGETWKGAVENAIKNKATLHFIGLLSDGNVHSHINHLLDMLDKAAKAGVGSVACHVLLDGRDVDGRSAIRYLAKLETRLAAINANYRHYNYRIASGGGRMITTMDRYNADWSIVERGWIAHVLGEAPGVSSAASAVEAYYGAGDGNDQFIPSFTVCDASGKPKGPIVDGDSVVLTNFRGDRAIELCLAFESESFKFFDRKRVPNVYFAGMMQYDGDLQIPSKYLVTPPSIAHPVSEYMAALNLKSFAISETQKYGHVTYFWNGNKSGYINENLETFVEIESDRIPFNEAPKMKASEITQETIALLRTGDFDFGRVNFPNGDMVGHTGVMDAVITSIEVTDECVGRIIDAVNELGGVTVVLADHGNADEMYTEKNGEKIPKTCHTLNPVPCAIVGPDVEARFKMANVSDPGLANVAATLLNLLGYEAPSDYEPSLVEPRG
ncbi:MAG: 2,3-bisphosphoglycerate-independent phosphoglycerate mutase [bacterium]|nr:2,3-bisphosphoglycerate-independent phosphoglycerate mutase [bacterium]